MDAAVSKALKPQTTSRIDREFGTKALLLVAAILIGTSYRSMIAVPGLLLPLIFLKRKDYLYLAPLICLLLFKILLCLVLDDVSTNYTKYIHSDPWLIREPATIFLFYCWVLLGYRKFSIETFARQKPWVLLAIIGATYVSMLVFNQSIIVSGIDNAQALLWLVFFTITAIPGRSKLFRLLIIALILGTALIPRESSFTVFTSLIMIFFYMISKSRLAKKQVSWRAACIICTVFLMTASTFAYLVHLRGTRANGEGNNGHTRAILAEAGYEQFLEDPFIGTPYGRGILPMKVIQQLGWDQYFTDPREFNIYNLSFHDSFIYLLTRYGIFCLIPFALLFYRIPRTGPLPFVFFTFVFFLSMGANVVIESLRAGPGVGLALGMLFATNRTMKLGKATKPKILLHKNFLEPPVVFDAQNRPSYRI